jgi:Uma2 family endonuclease
MRGVTLTEFLVHGARDRWTVDDLQAIPDDGMRYEIFDGSLLVSPMANLRHARVTHRLARLLEDQAPSGIFVTGVGVGVSIRGGSSYFIPDIVALRDDGPAADAPAVSADHVLLVVEVLSPSNAGTDLILKRHEYAVAKIPVYLIADPVKQTLTAMEHDGNSHCIEAALVSRGEQFTTDTPFRIAFDLAEIFA